MPTYILISFKNCSKANLPCKRCKGTYVSWFRERSCTNAVRYLSFARAFGRDFKCGCVVASQQLASPIAGIGEWRLMASLLVRGRDGSHGHMLCERFNRLLLWSSNCTIIAAPKVTLSIVPHAIQQKRLAEQELNFVVTPVLGWEGLKEHDDALDLTGKHMSK